MQRIDPKKLVVLMAVGTVLGGLFPATLNATTTTATYEKLPSVNIQAPDKLDLWIDELVQLESEGKTNIKVLDTNNKHSFGCLQFQKATFVEFGMKYDLLDSPEDAVQKIYDCDFQKKLARQMIEDNYKNWRHWFTSVRVKKLGPPPVTSRPITAQSKLARLDVHGSSPR